MKKILIPLAPGFEEIEFCAPVDILRRLGFEVCTAGLDELQVEGAHGIIMQADSLLAEVDASSFDALVLPGGQASWTLRDSELIQQLIKEKHAQGSLIAAICAAPIALEAAGVLAGHKLTCYPAPAVVEELCSVAEISSDTVVHSGQILTGKGPGAALEFGFAIATALGKGDAVAAMRTEMCL